MGSTSSTLAALMRVWSLSAWRVAMTMLAINHLTHTQNVDRIAGLKRTVISTPSSARIRAA
jgi:hypothetical protein